MIYAHKTDSENEFDKANKHFVIIPTVHVAQDFSAKLSDMNQLNCVLIRIYARSFIRLHTIKLMGI